MLADVAPPFPVFVNCRDRVSCLRMVVDWLERAGHERIYLVDNASTFPALLEYYEETPHVVVRLEENAGHRAPWRSGLTERYAPDTPYVVTDPDVVPADECPNDAAAFLADLLDRYPEARKVGLGLVIDDLPEHYKMKKYVQMWESQHWLKEAEPGVFVASVDTTFAVYRPGEPFAKRPALRTGGPYVARHLPWYVDSEHLTEEESYYREHALRDVTSWNQDRLPPRLDGYFHRSPLARVARRFRALRTRG
jgi:hypothetical protein